MNHQSWLMFARMSALACLLSITLVLGGCGGKVQYVGQKEVKVTELRSYKEGDFMIVKAVLRNVNPNYITQTAYSVQWLNSSGQTIKTTDWHPVTIKGGRGVDLMEHSVIPGASSFILHLADKGTKGAPKIQETAEKPAVAAQKTSQKKPAEKAPAQSAPTPVEQPAEELPVAPEDYRTPVSSSTTAPAAQAAKPASAPQLEEPEETANADELLEGDDAEPTASGPEVEESSFDQNRDPLLDLVYEPATE